MANLGDKSWDPYETSQMRDFVYRPNSVTPALRPKTSKSFETSYWLTGPKVSTVYNEEFCWKPASKPISIRTGSSSGNRRNNPHPSKEFMVWRLPPNGFQGSSANDESLKKRALSEQEIRDVLSSQYCSTYRADYLGIPQGFDMKHAFLAPLSQEQDVPRGARSEMRRSYQRVQQKPELKGNTSRYGCNALHKVAAKGIVPTTVHGHIHNRENSKWLTTYKNHFGEEMGDICGFLRSLKPHELHKFSENLPASGRKALHTVLHGSDSNGLDKMKRNPLRLPQMSSGPVRMSMWPGPT